MTQQAPELQASLGEICLPLDREGRPYSVGREPGSDFLANHRSVSRAHATIERALDGGWQFRDLGSSNGSFDARGMRVDEVAVFPGLVIRLGGTSGETLTFEGVPSDMVEDPDRTTSIADLPTSPISSQQVTNAALHPTLSAEVSPSETRPESCARCGWSSDALHAYCSRCGSPPGREARGAASNARSLIVGRLGRPRPRALLAGTIAGALLVVSVAAVGVLRADASDSEASGAIRETSVEVQPDGPTTRAVGSTAPADESQKLVEGGHMDELLPDALTISALLDLERIDELETFDYEPGPTLGSDPASCLFDSALGGAQSRARSFQYPLTSPEASTLQTSVEVFRFESGSQAKDAVQEMAQIVQDCDGREVTEWYCENCDGIATFRLDMQEVPSPQLEGPSLAYTQSNLMLGPSVGASRVEVFAHGNVVARVTVHRAADSLSDEEPAAVSPPGTGGVHAVASTVLDLIREV